VRNIDIFVSNGGDTNGYRDLVADAISRLRQMIRYEMNLAVTISYWDYRDATPDVVRRGTLSATSLANVDRSDALIAIFGKRVPEITTKEIHQAFRRRQDGKQQAVFVFANPAQLAEAHRAFFKEIEETYGEEVVFGHYSNKLNFQAGLYTTLTRYLFEQLATANQALLGGAAA
jgi:hypothetical protein